MSIGRPLLVVPFADRFETVGRHVLLGWDGSRKAARAVHDALPLVHPGGKLTLLSIIPAKNVAYGADLPTTELAEHLSRYHTQVGADRSIIDDKIAVLDALLNYVHDNAADLLIIGGYGHSLIWEAIFGGVTRAILEQDSGANVPHADKHVGFAALPSGSEYRVPDPGRSSALNTRRAQVELSLADAVHQLNAPFVAGAADA
jgi:nucleotide-binding universal stress UspA family protein